MEKEKSFFKVTGVAIYGSSFLTTEVTHSRTATYDIISANYHLETSKLLHLSICQCNLHHARKVGQAGCATHPFAWHIFGSYYFTMCLVSRRLEVSFRALIDSLLKVLQQFALTVQHVRNNLSEESTGHIPTLKSVQLNEQIQFMTDSNERALSWESEPVCGKHE